MKKYLCDFLDKFNNKLYSRPILQKNNSDSILSKIIDLSLDILLIFMISSPISDNFKTVDLKIISIILSYTILYLFNYIKFYDNFKDYLIDIIFLIIKALIIVAIKVYRYSIQRFNKTPSSYSLSSDSFIDIVDESLNGVILPLTASIVCILLISFIANITLERTEGKPVKFSKSFKYIVYSIALIPMFVLFLFYSLSLFVHSTTTLLSLLKHNYNLQRCELLKLFNISFLSLSIFIFIIIIIFIKIYRNNLDKYNQVLEDTKTIRRYNLSIGLIYLFIVLSIIFIIRITCKKIEISLISLYFIISVPLALLLHFIYTFCKEKYPTQK